MQNFFSSINRYVLKAIFNQVSNVILHFFFVFALVCTAIVHEKLYQSLNQFSAKMFFFYIFFLIKGEGLKRRIQKLFAEASFLSSTQMIKPNCLFILPFPSAQMQKHSFCRNSPPLFSFLHFSFIAFQLGYLFLLLQFVLGNL